jgi:hypothetical protein
MPHLTVIHPFGEYQRGDKIRDEAKIKAILEGEDGVPHENNRNVIRTSEPEETT